ncbi:hypothetical protein OIU85_004466 [Salix viminalis]|uniref:Uncharacterized protein n=1 Tax=Salix viminalis TaxID=40686 RepID=A0A9Q0SXU2_SALVM|nr:hypothetical protein OIU85_004466 [Salix viminalis]
MAAALASNDNRTQPTIARLEALENDYTGMEIVEAVDDDEASLDDDDDGITILLNDFVGERLANKRNCSIAQPTPQSIYKRNRKAQSVRLGKQKHFENARKAPINFLELLHEANLEALPPHVPSYMRAAMGPPSSTWHFYTVCGFTSNYTYAKCGMPFVQSDARKIHDDTCCPEICGLIGKT